MRLQALVRGRLVRRQLAVTLKCMHALLRVQERAREQRARSTAAGLGSQDASLNGRATSTKDAEVHGTHHDALVCFLTFLRFRTCNAIISRGRNCSVRPKMVYD